MVKFHVNDNGESAPCRAEKRPCRYGEENHYGTAAEAVKAAEERNSRGAQELPTVKKEKITVETFQASRYKAGEMHNPLRIVTPPPGEGHPFPMRARHQGDVQSEYGDGYRSVKATEKNLNATLQSQALRTLEADASHKNTPRADYPAHVALTMAYQVQNLRTRDWGSYGEETKAEQVKALVQTGLVSPENEKAAAETLSRAADAYDGGKRETRGTYDQERNKAIVKALKRKKLLN